MACVRVCDSASFGPGPPHRVSSGSTQRRRNPDRSSTSRMYGYETVEAIRVGQKNTLQNSMLKAT